MPAEQTYSVRRRQKTTVLRLSGRVMALLFSMDGRGMASGITSNRLMELDNPEDRVGPRHALSVVRRCTALGCQLLS